MTISGIAGGFGAISAMNTARSGLGRRYRGGGGKKPPDFDWDLFIILLAPLFLMGSILIMGYFSIGKDNSDESVSPPAEISTAGDSRD